MGSGSLLLNAKRYSKEASTVRYFGQEINASTFNLARMNMMLHGVPIENQNSTSVTPWIKIGQAMSRQTLMVSWWTHLILKNGPGTLVSSKIPAFQATEF